MGLTVSKCDKLVMRLLLCWRRFSADQSLHSSTGRKLVAIPCLQLLVPNSCLRPHLIDPLQPSTWRSQVITILIQVRDVDRDPEPGNLMNRRTKATISIPCTSVSNDWRGGSVCSALYRLIADGNHYVWIPIPAPSSLTREPLVMGGMNSRLDQRRKHSLRVIAQLSKDAPIVEAASLTILSIGEPGSV